MARRASARFQALDPVGLALDVRVDAVAARRVAREVALLRHADHREPEAGRIVLRGGARIGRSRCGEVDDLSGRGLHLRRIDEAVAAHPHVVVRLRQIGQQVASAIVGDDDLHELRRQVLRLGNHPDAGFGPVRARDDAADIVGVEAHGVSGLRHGLHRDRRRAEKHSEAHCHPARVQQSRRVHESTPCVAQILPRRRVLRAAIYASSSMRRRDFIGENPQHLRGTWLASTM